MLLFLLQDHRVMKQIQDMGTKLVEELERCKSCCTASENLQVLHKKFKKDVEQY